MSYFGRKLTDKLLLENLNSDKIIYCYISELYRFLQEAITIDALYKGVRDYMGSQPAKQDREFAGAGLRVSGNIKKLEVIPFWGTKMLDFEAQVKSASSNNLYTIKMQFYGMDFSEDFSKKTPVKWEDKKGNVFYSSLLHPHTRIGVNCTCPDFRFTFSWWLKNKGSLTGKLKKYQRKTIDRKPRNVGKVVGACKHIFSILTALEQIGIYTPSKYSNVEIDSKELLKK